MKSLSQKSSDKLQKILSKRMGRTLSRIELEEAYSNLMEFAVALVDLSSDSRDEKTTQSGKNLHN